jgi:hypothetical protein
MRTPFADLCPALKLTRSPQCLDFQILQEPCGRGKLQIQESGFVVRLRHGCSVLLCLRHDGGRWLAPAQPVRLIQR